MIAYELSRDVGDDWQSNSKAKHGPGLSNRNLIRFFVKLTNSAISIFIFPELLAIKRQTLVH